MGILDFLSKQFVDVIEWVEEENGILAYRYPMQDKEIQNGAKLTVRDSQLALFINEGKIADQFSPGLFTLTTNTLPILTYLQNWDKAFQSPFKSDVYYFSTREQIDQKWGTATPLTIRDKEFGPIRIQAHGIFSYQIIDPKVFYLKVSGSRDIYRAEDFNGQLRGIVLTTLATALGGSAVGFVDMAANAQAISDTIKSALEKAFDDYGIIPCTFQVQSFSLPDEVQKKLDERSGMSIVGNLNQYMQFQTAQSIPLAAQNEGGVAGIGAGIGAGAAFAQAMSQSITQGTPTPEPSQSSNTQVDPFTQIEKLHELQKKGIISVEEFEAKKKELLAQIK
jgi:membrane protease subunit (stomatin/prohibitin family)